MDNIRINKETIQRILSCLTLAIIRMRDRDFIAKEVQIFMPYYMKVFMETYSRQLIKPNQTTDDNLSMTFMGINILDGYDQDKIVVTSSKGKLPDRVVNYYITFEGNNVSLSDEQRTSLP